MKKTILITTFLFFILFMVNVNAETFGNIKIPETSDFIIDWNWIESNVEYKLVRDNVIDVTEYIIDFDFQDGQRKYSYSFNAVPEGFYSFKMEFQHKSISSYIENNIAYFNYSNYTLFYDYNDIINLGYTVKSMTDDDSFKMTVNGYFKGNVVLDPVFGWSGAVEDNPTLYDNTVEYMLGSFFTCVYDGIADNITVKTHGVTTSISAVCAIYQYVDYGTDFAGVLIGTTEEKTVDTSTTLYIFNFSGVKPVLESGTTYYLTIGCSNTSTSTNNVQIQAKINNNNGFITSTGTGSLPLSSPLTSESDRNIELYILCSYTAIELVEDLENCTGDVEWIYDGENITLYANYSGNSTVMWIAGGSNLDININIETSLIFMSLLIIIWIFFVTKYYETKRKIFAIIQFGLTFPLCIEIAVISISYIFGYVLVIAIPLIGLYIIIDGLIYNKTKKE